eukprot:14534566-Alexandrium_andersonii.AAC.1
MSGMHEVLGQVASSKCLGDRTLEDQIVPRCSSGRLGLHDFHRPGGGDGSAIAREQMQSTGGH